MNFRSTTLLLTIGSLWLAYALLLGSAIQKSATVDEQSHLFRGAAYLRAGATQFLLGHPLGASALSALPLLTEPDLRLPQESDAWEAGDWSVAGDLFLWQINANPRRLILLGRLPVMWLTLLLGALVFRWGRQLVNPVAGLAAMALLLFDPNVLAHGRLITGDLALSLFFTLTIYGYWRWAEQSKRGEHRGHWPLLLAGIGLGLAAVSKFNAALLLPILMLLALGLSVSRRSWRPLLALLSIFLIGGGVIWLIYGLALRPLPGGVFWEDLLWQLRYAGQSHGQYLFGQSSAQGWWYYFPVTFLLKTPLPTLLTLLVGLGVTVWKRPWRAHNTWFLLLPAFVTLLASMSSALNIGVRYLIPMFPFLILAAITALWQPGLRNHIRYAATAAALALALVSVRQWPDYLPYFNLFAGGADVSWRLLSDSNVDWGQDLPALAAWQEQTERPLLLSYFGTAHPSAYGVQALMLPTWPPGPEQTPSALQPFYPPQPAPGTYAISVTNLHGVVLGDRRDTFAWFRRQKPTARIGGSIFIYDVPANGPAANVAFAGLVPARLDETLYTQFPSNDLRPRWFDARSSFIWPAGGGWLAVAVAQQPAGELAAFWPETALIAVPDAVPPQSLFRVTAPAAELLNLPAIDYGGVVTLRGWRQLAAPAGQVALLTIWEVTAETKRPLQIFVHALDKNGGIMGQWDGLHVPPTYWKEGDIFVQSHSFAVDDMATFQKLVTGVYDADNLQRLAEPFTLME